MRALALDGNVDPVAWSRPGRLDTTLRLHSDQATGRTATAFLNRCGRAGRGRCAFSAGSAGATRAKFAALVRRVRAHPQRFRGEVIDPPALLASFAGSSTRRSPSPAASLAGRPSGRSSRRSGAGRTPSRRPPLPRSDAIRGPSTQTRCGARTARARLGRPPYPRFARLSVRRSGMFGLFWVWGDFPCASWPARAADRYTGPWNRPTANPILVVGNTGDPATAYRGSVRMARLLARGRLLTVTGFGHTELLNPSRCVARPRGRVLPDGCAPPNGTVCRQDTAPFARGG